MLRNLLAAVIFWTRAGVHHQTLYASRGVRAMQAELETKVEKYESRAAKCEEQAKAAKEKSQQNFYGVLASYYRNLAADFRTIIEKRKTA
jgi:phage shock protein A